MVIRMNEARYRASEERFWDLYGASPTERWLNLKRPAVKVRVQVIGKGLPVLFLHGGPGAGTIFAPLASRLKDFRCFILDRPGCALSPPIDYSHTRLDDTMVDIVRSVLDAEDLSNVRIVTSSFGGSCAMWFAQRDPERVVRIAHVGCPAFVSQMRISFMHRLLAMPGLGYLAARLPMNRAGVSQFLKMMKQNPEHVPEQFFTWWISLAQDTDTMRNERELVCNGLTWRGMRPEYVLADKAVQFLEHPMYFYWGADDPFATTEFAASLVRGMKRARIDFIAGSGHLPWFDDPHNTAERVRAFLS
jgi:2-hydroxy-6-oxonona-2,4-dienedioate hydrolase